MTQEIRLLNYKQVGSGDHIVLIHGLFGTLDNLNMVAKPLSEQYCVTSIDVRNHGDSFHANTMDYAELAQDVIRLLDHLKIKKCLLLGHSMGGKIAIQIAIEQPKRIEKLLVADIAPVTYPPHHLKIIEGLQAIDLTKVKSRKDADVQLAPYVDDINIRQFLLRNLTKNDQNEFTFKCSLVNISESYAQIMQANKLPDDKAPYSGETLFIKGGKSDYILPEHSEAIAKILPNSKAKVIQGAGHWLHAEKSIAFNKIVAGFIKR